MSEMPAAGPLAPMDAISAPSPLLTSPMEYLLDDIAALLDGPAAIQRHGDALELLSLLVCRAAETVDRTDWASITLVRRNKLSTMAFSHPQALSADELQYQLRSGPSLAAVNDDAACVSGDVQHDDRWPRWGRSVYRFVGVRSVLAFRLQLLADDNHDATLNLYSTTSDAVDDTAIKGGLLLATQCALAVSAHLANDRADNLMQGLSSNREIGIAMGVLMTRHRISREQAFALLRTASQDTNRKLASVATQVADTGELPMRHLRLGNTRNGPKDRSLGPA